LTDAHTQTRPTKHRSPTTNPANEILTIEGTTTRPRTTVTAARDAASHHPLTTTLNPARHRLRRRCRTVDRRPHHQTRPTQQTADTKPANETLAVAGTTTPT
jgi:hypothetical protein